jgi:hypothetical protein
MPFLGEQSFDVEALNCNIDEGLAFPNDYAWLMLEK